MADLVVLKPKALTPQGDTIQLLESMLEEARSGEMTSFAGVIEYHDETYQTVHGAFKSRRALAGALLEASINVLK